MMKRICIGWWLAALAATTAAAETPPPADEPVAAAEAEATPAPLTGRMRDHSRHSAQPLPDIRPHAAAVLPYAALAHDVYCNDRIARVDDEACRRETGIERWGWALLGEFPTGDMLGGRSRRGLHLAVYYADDGPTHPVRIGVAFKGTDFTSWSDWHSNLRWFLPGRDQYDVVAEIAHAVVERSQREIAGRLGRPVDAWHIVATGHSLGGGLAQLFAYKHADVKAAIAFDPSPVTGFYGCVPAAEVNCNVPVWRVYERGEVLAWVRSATRLLLPLSENITELELDLLHGSVIANHSMARFYRQLDDTVRPHHVATAPTVDLFATRFDCDCSRTRRPELWRQAEAACEALAREKGAPLPATQALMAAWMP